jgi:hypothetical protein
MREPLDRPRRPRLGVQRRERLTDDRVAEPCEPTGFGRRQPLEVPANRLDEHQFRETRQDVFAAGASAARLADRDVQEGGQPAG